MYYVDKLNILQDIFGTQDISLENDHLILGQRAYPIVDDVIILLDESQYPASLKKRLGPNALQEIQKDAKDFAEDIQFTFGHEWKEFPSILPEHEDEFRSYFDLVDISKLENARVCDLGCGIGRWSFFLKKKCRELVLVDFSGAIFVARRNLKDAQNALFFMCDLKQLPFRADFADFLFCLGVLHHLPTNALDEVRSLNRFAPEVLIYLYYALDNRPFYFRVLLTTATLLRRATSRIRAPVFRSGFTWVMAVFGYYPFVLLGRLLEPFGWSCNVPLYEGYNGKSFERIRQDVYDRFFTRIEQRFSKRRILELRDTFAEVIVSERLPYWHFICKRNQ